MRSILVVAMAISLVAHADAPKSPGKGFWKILVKPGAKWTLYDWFDELSVKNGDKREIGTLTIETYDVRKVGDADVARVRWRQSGSDDDALQYTHAPGLTQFAVTSAGLYMFYASADDAKIAEALKGKPSRSDPPKPYPGTKTNEGRYLEIRDGLVCMGWNMLPDDPPCEDVCGASVCISQTEGIVSIDGNWAPDDHDFAAHSLAPATKAQTKTVTKKLKKRTVKVKK